MLITKMHSVNCNPLTTAPAFPQSFGTFAAKTQPDNTAHLAALSFYSMKSLLTQLFVGSVLLVSLAACGGGDTGFVVPETREEQLTLLDAKKREIREINANIAELERALGNEEKQLSTRLVEAQPVSTTDFKREIELQATVESDEIAVVTTELPGRVTAVLVEDGKYVTRGQVLVRINLESYDVQVAEVETNLALARDILARQERLREQNIGTEVQYLEAKNAVDRLVKAKEQLQLNLAKGDIKAPISGTVENKMVNPGEYAAPGSPLMQILDAATVKVVADVPESYLLAVKKGQQVRVKFPNINVERTARVADIGRTIDAANRTFRVELELNNRDRLLKPNMLAAVYLVDYENKDVVLIGNEAILEEIDGREYVYVARLMEGKKDIYTADKVYVKTGKNDATRREILEGLQPNDYLVTQGMRSLTEGEAITLKLQPSQVAQAN